MIRMEVTIDTKGIEQTFEDIEAEITTSLFKEGKRFNDLYYATVSNWKVKPEFEISVDVGRDEASVFVGTNNMIYKYLHDGTKVRWALMSDPFEPKTHPRILGVGPGVGHVVARGRSGFAKAGIPEARPGIRAREWSQEIVKRENQSKQFEKNMQTAFDRAVRKGGAQVQ